MIRTNAKAASDSNDTQNMTAMETAHLQHDMVAWRQRQQASQARTTLPATTTTALVIRKLKMEKKNTHAHSAVRIKSMVTGVRVRQRLHAVKDLGNSMAAKEMREEEKASRHWEHKALGAALWAMQPMLKTHANLFAESMKEKHWTMRQL